MSGYNYCACRDCFEILVGEWGEFCDECKEAGCPDYQGTEGMSQECKREDAYGEGMPAHTRVKIHPNGSATVHEGTNVATWPIDAVERAVGMSESCCESRKVYFPAGQEHCPCLACNVAKAWQKWVDTEARNHHQEQR